MLKIVIVGAGSGFGSRLSVDIMSRETIRDATICLCDINEYRLKKVTDYVKGIAIKHNLPTKFISSTNRDDLLPGADFVITSISVGGGAYYGYPFKEEIEIPKKYGIDQSVADTCSVGAVFRFLRTGPVQQQILRDVERHCPNAYVLNHTNPMAMLIWLHSIDTNLRNVGLCHGVQHTANVLAKDYLGISEDEIRFKVAGINHLAWFLELRKGKEDLYPNLRNIINNSELIANQNIMKNDKVRIEILKQFGYFPTESTKHDSEYMPYFRQTPEIMKHFGLETNNISDKQKRVRAWEDEAGTIEVKKDEELVRSQEYTTGIIEAILTDVPFRFNGNVMNTGLITNLPQECCVEVPCMVDSSGINPCYVGDLPTQLAALDRANIAVQELAVEAVLNKDKEAAFYACTLCPITSAILPLHRIREMFEELWEAEKNLLLWFDKSYKGKVPEICAP